ncbi:hypothetical protein [Desulfurococcus amylolyticus]|nr:hypothetical protein [Desulfurococcus amylolyticus]
MPSLGVHYNTLLEYRFISFIYSSISMAGAMVSIYVFEAKVVKTVGKYLIYPPREYQGKLKKLHGGKQR